MSNIGRRGEQEELRARMRAAGMTHDQIAGEGQTLATDLREKIASLVAPGLRPPAIGSGPTSWEGSPRP
jgi:hypothetical protein